MMRLGGENDQFVLIVDQLVLLSLGSGLLLALSPGPLQLRFLSHRKSSMHLRRRCWRRPTEEASLPRHFKVLNQM